MANLCVLKKPPFCGLVFLFVLYYIMNFVHDRHSPFVNHASMLTHFHSLYHEPALTRFTACYAGCSFSNGTRKTNAAFGVACFSSVLIIPCFLLICNGSSVSFSEV